MGNASFPGIFITQRDGGLVAIPTEPTTDRLLIIGPALDGPVSTPIAITSPSQAREWFGGCEWSNAYPDPAMSAVPTGAATNFQATHDKKIWNGNELARAVSEAFAAGCNNILCVRVGGEDASTLNSAVTATDVAMTGTPYISSGYVFTGVGKTSSGDTGGISIYAKSLYPSFRYNGIGITGTVGAAGLLTVAVSGNIMNGNVALESLPYTAASGETIGTFLKALNTKYNSFGVNFVSDFTDPSVAYKLVNTFVSGTTSYSTSGTGAGTYNGVTLAGGTYGVRVPEFSDRVGTTAQEVYDSVFHPITGAAASVSEFAFDMAALVGISADEPVSGYIHTTGKNPTDGMYSAAATTTQTLSPAKMFARFIYDVSQHYPCHGVIGCRPTVITKPDVMRTYINDVYLNTTSGAVIGTGSPFSGYASLGFQLKDGIKMFADNGEVVDLGSKISIIAGVPLTCSNADLGDYTTNGVVSYASKPTTLTPDKGMLFQTMGNVKGILGLQIPTELAMYMSQGIGSQGVATNSASVYAGATAPLGSAYVVIKNMPQVNGTRPTVQSDVTAAMRDSDFEILSLVRLVNAAVKYVQQASVPFIGKPNSYQTQTAMSTQIRSALNTLVSAGALLGGEGIGYDFTISQGGVGSIKSGELTISLALTPSMVIRRINVTVRVTQ